MLGDQGRDDTWQEFLKKYQKERDTEEKKRSCLSDESFLMRQEIRPHVNGALLFQIPVIHWLSRGPFQKQLIYINTTCHHRPLSDQNVTYPYWPCPNRAAGNPARSAAAKGNPAGDNKNI